MRQSILIVLCVAAPLLLFGFAQAQQPVARFINPEGLNKPTGYTHVVEARGGRTIYMAGQVSLDAAGNLVGKGDFEAQCRQVYANLRTAVEAAGGRVTDVVKMNTYVTTMDLDAFRAARAAAFGSHAPANTLVQVVALARPEFLIEVEAIAIVPN